MLRDLDKHYFKKCWSLSCVDLTKMIINKLYKKMTEHDGILIILEEIRVHHVEQLY